MVWWRATARLAVLSFNPPPSISSSSARGDSSGEDEELDPVVM